MSPRRNEFRGGGYAVYLSSFVGVDVCLHAVVTRNTFCFNSLELLANTVFMKRRLKSSSRVCERDFNSHGVSSKEEIEVPNASSRENFSPLDLTPCLTISRGTRECCDRNWINTNVLQFFCIRIKYLQSLCKVNVGRA